MSTPAPLYGCPVDPVVARFHANTPAQAGAVQSEAANDPAQQELEATDYRNPLWLIAIAMACLFGAMAALLALG